jgi:hypothetical protein
MPPEFKLPRLGKGAGARQLRLKEIVAFAIGLMEIGASYGYKVSVRGWCYILEGLRLIDKDQFALCESIINECRREGLLPVDFVAEEEARGFSGIEIPEDRRIDEYLLSNLNVYLNLGRIYTPDWWKGEEYYIQMVVEKVDLKTIFLSTCKDYKIPIATSKGWSSLLQRADYARRFKEVEENGLMGVLLYCGDHDPDGLRISDTIRKNLSDLANAKWEDGTEGYDPSNLIIDRFGLNYDFITANNLTWIDNLLTGAGKNLADPKHHNHNMPYVQEYLAKIGVRKCEANAIMSHPSEGEALVRHAIEKYLGADSRDRFKKKRLDIIAEFEQYIGEGTKAGDAVRVAIDELKSGG